MIFKFFDFCEIFDPKNRRKPKISKDQKIFRISCAPSLDTVLTIKNKDKIKKRLFTMIKERFSVMCRSKMEFKISRILIFLARNF